jgi:SAM-dependent methyltransferase
LHQSANRVGHTSNTEVFSAARRSSKQAVTETCILCGSGIERVLSGLIDTRFGTPGSYEIHRCSNCGLERTWPVPSLAELKSLYEAQYNFGGETGTRYTRLREQFLMSFLYRLWIHIDGDISFHAKGGSGRLLDVGCNEGRGLRIYRGNGFQAEGLELNERAAMQARNAGFNVHTCLLGDYAAAASYDVAVLSNVLEHSLDPRQMLRDVHRILKSDGTVWISCPSGRSWLRKIFGRSWINWHVPFHIFHFSPETLRALLTDSGYKSVEIHQITPSLWVAQSFITWCFAKKDRKTKELRNPFLAVFLMLFARFILFPALWFGNRIGCGDCILAVAAKAE